ncbi:AraC family transcriptional regulator [Mucilaginibacter sp. 10I4]|nr:AraC family transcriptional regulator [Mucilaginibacter sp. 10I4]
MSKAISCLKSSNYSLSKIGYLTGFSNQSHFKRIFKKNMGTKSSDYRKSVVKERETI